MISEEIIQKLVAAARKAEAVLAEQHDNCGGGTDTLYHDPLQDIRAALAPFGGLGDEEATP